MSEQASPSEMAARKSTETRLGELTETIARDLPSTTDQQKDALRRLRAAATEAQEELDSRQEEILRLRDLLIGKDAELGAAKGRLAELDDRSMRISNAKRQLAQRFPLLRKLVGPLLNAVRREPR